eukprot:TRINITY_DN29917_c0_g1_i2.p1 TRINITY_DN29917_c0_g1~~TRINITY_DN29917_c0_g1_i2.p1  ORF type:complete len:1325 (+),score=323.59 TRINITY_DN29917_c0_g1_i2:71-4045(+)
MDAAGSENVRVVGKGTQRGRASPLQASEADLERCMISCDVRERTDQQQPPRDALAEQQQPAQQLRPARPTAGGRAQREDCPRAADEEDQDDMEGVKRRLFADEEDELEPLSKKLRAEPEPANANSTQMLTSRSLADTILDEEASEKLGHIEVAVLPDSPPPATGLPGKSMETGLLDRSNDLSYSPLREDEFMESENMEEGSHGQHLEPISTQELEVELDKELFGSLSDSSVPPPGSADAASSSGNAQLAGSGEMNVTPPALAGDVPSSAAMDVDVLAKSPSCGADAQGRGGLPDSAARGERSASLPRATESRPAAVEAATDLPEAVFTQDMQDALAEALFAPVAQLAATPASESADAAMPAVATSTRRAAEGGGEEKANLELPATVVVQSTPIVPAEPVVQQSIASRTQGGSVLPGRARQRSPASAAAAVSPQRPRIVSGFGSERVDDVAADEARRMREGASRGDWRRQEGLRGRMIDMSGQDLDRAAGGAFSVGRRIAEPARLSSGSEVPSQSHSCEVRSKTPGSGSKTPGSGSKAPGPSSKMPGSGSRLGRSKDISYSPARKEQAAKLASIVAAAAAAAESEEPMPPSVKLLESTPMEAVPPSSVDALFAPDDNTPLQIGKPLAPDVNTSTGSLGWPKTAAVGQEDPSSSPASIHTPVPQAGSGVSSQIAAVAPYPDSALSPPKVDGKLDAKKDDPFGSSVVPADEVTFVTKPAKVPPLFEAFQQSTRNIFAKKRRSYGRLREDVSDAPPLVFDPARPLPKYLVELPHQSRCKDLLMQERLMQQQLRLQIHRQKQREEALADKKAKAKAKRESRRQAKEAAAASSDKPALGAPEASTDAAMAPPVEDKTVREEQQPDQPDADAPMADAGDAAPAPEEQLDAVMADAVLVAGPEEEGNVEGEPRPPKALPAAAGEARDSSSNFAPKNLDALFSEAASEQQAEAMGEAEEAVAAAETSAAGADADSAYAAALAAALHSPLRPQAVPETHAEHVREQEALPQAATAVDLSAGAWNKHSERRTPVPSESMAEATVDVPEPQPGEKPSVGRQPHAGLSAASSALQPEAAGETPPVVSKTAPALTSAAVPYAADSIAAHAAQMGGSLLVVSEAAPALVSAAVTHAADSIAAPAAHMGGHLVAFQEASERLRCDEPRRCHPTATQLPQQALSPQDAARRNPRLASAAVVVRSPTLQQAVLARPANTPEELRLARGLIDAKKEVSAAAQAKLDEARALEEQAASARAAAEEVAAAANAEVRAAETLAAAAVVQRDQAVGQPAAPAAGSASDNIASELRMLRELCERQAREMNYLRRRCDEAWGSGAGPSL